MKKYLTFYLVLLGVLLILPVLYWLSCQLFLQLSLKKGDLWIYPIRVVKMAVTAEMPSPKIVVMSGSNGMFFDSETLSKELHMPVGNLAVFGGVPLRFFRCDLDRVVKKGDVVVLPLEFEYYTAEDMGEAGLYLLYEWADDYYDSLTEREKVELLFRNSEEWYLRHLSKFLCFRVRHRELVPPEIILLHWREKHGNTPWPAGTLLGANQLNDHGDILVNGDPEKFQEDWTLPPYPKRISEYFLGYYREMADSIRAKGAIPVLTWPALCRGRAGNPEEFRRLAAEHGLHLYGKPMEFEKRFFYDTGYHMTAEGARARSPYVAAAIREALAAEKASVAISAK